jgi:hypothetical protein
MGGEQDLQRFEQSGRLAGSFQQVLDLGFMAFGHSGDDRLFVGEIAIDQPNADPGFGADIVHTGLVKAMFGETNHGGLKDLRPTVKYWLWRDLRHWRDIE